MAPGQQTYLDLNLGSPAFAPSSWPAATQRTKSHKDWSNFLGLRDMHIDCENPCKAANSGHFELEATDLDVTVISKKKMSCRAVKKTAEAIAGGVNDHAMLSKMQLRQRYKAEANTHRNMLSREKSHGAVIHPEFRDFASFLRHVGPIPAKGATLDRVVNSDPEYGPNKVRWADKRTQNNNKSDTLLFHYSRTGDTYTVSRLSKLQKCHSSTIRKRLERGWTDDEIIEGNRATPLASSSNHSVGIRRRLPPVQAGPLLSASDITFERMAEEYRSYREETGEEAMMAPYEILKEELPEFACITPEGYERQFAKLWPLHRPHVIFQNLPISQQKLIEKIDPGYVRSRVAKEAENRLLKEQL
ncbi:hypothetical protein NKI36_06300 [Mesorhizobium caraganae]|uniref:Uncharacterized protein n=1 Tax=Mesorhizobium caraganae TaxID=483206 RepID=A0ABV1YV72_9HYPH